MIRANLDKVEIIGDELMVQAELTIILKTILENHKEIKNADEAKKYILHAVYCAMLPERENAQEEIKIAEELGINEGNLHFDDTAEEKDDIQEMFDKAIQEAEESHRKTIKNIRELEELIRKARE